MFKILVVDDEPVCTELLRECLTDEGYMVEVAGGGEDAIEVGLSFRPHILVTDWKLRDTIDGIEVAKELRSAIPDLKIIIFSGSPSDDLREQASDVPIAKILEKPCGLEVISSSIQETLQA